MLQFFLYLQLVHVVNQVRFEWVKVGIPGLVPANVLLLIVVLLLRGQEDVLQARQPLLKRAILIFYAALTLAFLWSQIHAPGDLTEDFTYYKNGLFAPLFYFIFLKCHQDEKSTRRLILWVLVIAAVAGLEGLRQGMAFGFGSYKPFSRASGPFATDWHHANRAGVYYGMFLPMFVALIVFLRKDKILRLAALTGAILTVGGAFSTYSRQSYFLCILAIVLLLVRRNIAIAGVIAVIGVSMIGFLPDSVTQRVEETKQQNKKGEEEVDASTASRWEIWEGGMKMFAVNPMGVGLLRFRNEIGTYSSHKNMDAHNFYVLTLCECGPFGLAALLYLLYTLFRLASFLRRNRPPDDPEALALTVGFTVCTLNMALGGIYGSPTLENAIMAPYWALCGLLERYVVLKSMGAPNVAQAPPPKVDSLLDRFPLAAHIPRVRPR